VTYGSHNALIHPVPVEVAMTETRLPSQPDLVIDPDRSSPVSSADRRGAARQYCNRVCFASPNGTATGVAWGARIWDISANGVGLLLGQELGLGTILAIKPRVSGPDKVLLARVVRRNQEDEGWFYGCELTYSLSEKEMREWMN